MLMKRQRTTRPVLIYTSDSHSPPNTPPLTPSSSESESPNSSSSDESSSSHRPLIDEVHIDHEHDHNALIISKTINSSRKPPDPRYRVPIWCFTLLFMLLALNIHQVTDFIQIAILGVSPNHRVRYRDNIVTRNVNPFFSRSDSTRQRQNFASVTYNSYDSMFSLLSTFSDESNEDTLSISVENHRHPMNWDMNHLQIPADTGMLPLDVVKLHYRQLARTYLSPFKSISRKSFFNILKRRRTSITPIGAKLGIQSTFFQIKSNRVYMTDPFHVSWNESKPFYRTRTNEVIWLLSRLATSGRLKNTEFLLHVHDCVQTVSVKHNYGGPDFIESNPAFTVAACNFSDNIPFPVWEGRRLNRDGGFKHWDESMNNYYSQDHIPWHDKIDCAVYRGQFRPSMYFKNEFVAHEYCDSVGRTKLSVIAKQNPNVLNVSLGGKCGDQIYNLQRLEPKEFHRFKYVFYVEGICMWADRLRHLIFGPSVIMKQMTPCGQFFEPLMKPYVHYIPTDFFFNDVIKQMEWVRKHDTEAKNIARNMRQFAKNFLTLRGIEAYVEVLLDEYTTRLENKDIVLEEKAEDVTFKRI